MTPIEHYEAALMAAFPEGASGKVFEHWNAARIAQTAPSVPEGWRLVPIEPTQEMRNAWDSSPICEDDDAEFRRAYSEMLAAAPEAKP